ncbi:MAG: CPBP family intramembrane glutamic endopeptidase [Mycobacteriales bacterium]|nr:MAG: hypothetical protein DLM56_04285 [Pseudonocardiales bacterium]
MTAATGGPNASAQPAPRHLQPRYYALDRAVAAGLEDTRHTWGFGQAVIPLAGLVLALPVAAVLVYFTHLPDVTASYLAYAALAWLVVRAARPVVEQAGSLQGALGWGAPRVHDAPMVLLWLLIAFGARYLAGAVVLALAPSLRHQQLSNVHLGRAITPSLIAAIVLVVVVAPPIEELVFRGLLLRASMRRFSFGVSSIATSVVFGVLHAWQEPTLLGGVFLAAATGSLGYVLCWLARRTNRLGPGIAVHALSNLLAAIVSLAT